MRRIVLALACLLALAADGRSTVLVRRAVFVPNLSGVVVAAPAVSVAGCAAPAVAVDAAAVQVQAVAPVAIAAVPAVAVVPSVAVVHVRRVAVFGRGLGARVKVRVGGARRLRLR
jgi:hypothetical protein